MEELTAGLEIHQQLDTKKLFCQCASALRDDPPEFIVQRMLRASAGETGEMDKAAAHEQAKAKEFHYHGYDTTCLVEIDEEPISEVNSNALEIALQVATMLDQNIMDEIHVMRKTVVDGSNTSGFQRTMLIGLGGSIKVANKKIDIEQLCLEEDACKIVKRTQDYDVFNLSRLGIPLIEITTAPQLHSGEEVKAVAAHIGMILRSTGKVKRGIGTIRQDVNVSVLGGARVEIKGAQDLDIISTLVENEAQRQRALINIAKIIPKQAYNTIDVTRAFAQTKGFIATSLQKGHKAIAIKLTGWKEALGLELLRSHRLGKELAGYAKANGFGGLIHSSEEFSTYKFTNEPQLVRELLECTDDDAWIVMIGDERLEPFYKTVLIPRIEQLSVGVPSEVRRAEQDGTTTYLRPMPGAARLYPETDVRVIIPDVSAISIPELLTEQSKRFQKDYGLSADLADQVCKEGLGRLFEDWHKKYPHITVGTLASLLASKEKEIKTRHNLDIDITLMGPKILEYLDNGSMSLASVEDVLVKLARGEPVDFDAYSPVDESEVRLVVMQLCKENPQASEGLLMGKVMRHFQNKVDGKIVKKMLSELKQ